MTERAVRYHPWRDLRDHWPQVEVRIEPMDGDLLGTLRYPVIALRAGTTTAQRRCTLAHEIVHLERGISDCGPWAEREERAVHAMVARRLIRPDELARALRDAGGTHDLAALATMLEVDTATLRLRLELVTPADRARVRAFAVRELWTVA